MYGIQQENKMKYPLYYAFSNGIETSLIVTYCMKNAYLNYTLT